MPRKHRSELKATYLPIHRSLKPDSEKPSNSPADTQPGMKDRTVQGSSTPESQGHPQAPYIPAAYSTERRSLNLSLEQALTPSEPLTFQWNSAMKQPGLRMGP